MSHLEELGRSLRRDVAVRGRGYVGSKSGEVQRGDGERVQRMRMLRRRNDERGRKGSHVDERETRTTDRYGDPRNASGA